MPYTAQGVGWKGQDTSEDQAKRMGRAKHTLQAQVLMVLRRFGPMTADECAAHLNQHELSIRPRFSELHHDDKIEPTGVRRDSALGRPSKVWRIKPSV